MIVVVIPSPLTEMDRQQATEEGGPSQGLYVLGQNSSFNRLYFLNDHGIEKIDMCGAQIGLNKYSPIEQGNKGQSRSKPAGLNAFKVTHSFLSTFKQPKRRIKMSALVQPFRTEAPVEEEKTNACTDRRM